MARTRKTGGPVRIRLVGLDPVQRETVARWIESKVGRLPEELANIDRVLQEQPDNTQLIELGKYKRNYISTLRHLAWLARTERPERSTE